MSEERVAIRRPEASDLADWNVLWNGYLTFYGAAVSADVTKTTWRRLVEPSEAIQGFVAVDRSGNMVGLVHYLFHPVTWSDRPRCYLEDLFVAEEARCRGVGRALVEAVYAAADEANADQVYWLTESSNENARKLYDRVGRLTTFIKYQR